MIPVGWQMKQIGMPVAGWIIAHPDAVVVIITLAVCVALVITFSEERNR